MQGLASVKYFRDLQVPFITLQLLQGSKKPCYLNFSQSYIIFVNYFLLIKAHIIKHKSRTFLKTEVR